MTSQRLRRVVSSVRNPCNRPQTALKAVCLIKMWINGRKQLPITPCSCGNIKRIKQFYLCSSFSYKTLILCLMRLFFYMMFYFFSCFIVVHSCAITRIYLIFLSCILQFCSSSSLALSFSLKTRTSRKLLLICLPTQYTSRFKCAQIRKT